MQNDAISRFLAENVLLGLNPLADKHECIKALSELPALDVAPVVHARWIPIKLYGVDHAIKCSACNNCDNPSKVPGRYCWQCGARMDGEADGI